MRGFVITCLIFSLIGCVNTNNTMPKSQYVLLSDFSGMLQRCFNDGMISTRTYADAKNAFSYTLNTWDYDQKILNTMMSNAYSNATPTASSCRRSEADTFQFISLVDKRDSNNQRIQKQNFESWENTLDRMNKNKPIYCNTIGSTTMCN